MDPRQMHFKGHHLALIDRFETNERVVKCLRCDLEHAMTKPEELGDVAWLPPEWCPADPDKPTEQQVEQEKLDAPMIVTGPDWEGTEAETLGLAVANAMQSVVEERDRARDIAVKLEADLARATDTLRELLKEWPQTSWAHDALPKENAEAVLAELTEVPDDGA